MLDTTKEYFVKTFKYRPDGWNSSGDMDHWMGKRVRISYDEDDREYLHIVGDKEGWYFKESDFEQIPILDDKLFEL